MVVEARFASIIAQTGKAGAVPVAHVDGKRSGSFAEGEVSATVEVVVDGGSIQSPA